MRFTYLFLINILFGSTCLAQGPTTLTRAINLTTVTSSGVLSDTTATLIIDGTNIGTRGISLTNLGTAMLSTQSLVSSLTLSGGNSFRISPTTGVGAVTLITTTTGVLTFSNIGVGSLTATDVAAIHLNTTVSGREGLRIVTQTGQTANLITVRSITTGTDYIAVSAAGTLAMRSAVGHLQQWGDPGNVRAVMQTTSGNPAFMNFGGGYGIGFNPSSNATGQDGSTVCVSSLTANTLRVTNTSGAAGNVAVGAIATGYRATATSSAMTLTDGILNITASGITVTLADSTSLTGRQSIIINTSAGTSTVAGLTATQTINGATTLSVPASSSLRVISTGTLNLSY